MITEEQIEELKKLWRLSNLSNEELFQKAAAIGYQNAIDKHAVVTAQIGARQAEEEKKAFLDTAMHTFHALNLGFGKTDPRLAVDEAHILWSAREADRLARMARGEQK